MASFIPSTAAAYAIDIDIELLKSASASIRPSSSSSSSSNHSTLSESSNYFSPIRTRKPRTPRKRPNQTYNEAAALLSSAYPNLFDKPIECSTTTWRNCAAVEEELLLPLAIKPRERRLGLVSKSDNCGNSRRLVEEEEFDFDFDTESILDEELAGIDGIMGNLNVKEGDECGGGRNLLWYGIPLGLGLGFKRGVRALRNREDCPAMETVEVEAIAPRQRVVVEKKKEEEEEVSVSDCRIELKLNYEEVLSAWSDRGSPFSGESPASEACGGDVKARLAQIDLFGEKAVVRKASVQRYKDKRKTRLSSTKIKSQVKKVDADQEPRTKGLVVKRADPSADVKA